MSGSLVSIIVPTYNRASLLDECLRNARSAPAGCEILVVDNSSTDETPAVIARHTADDSRIRSLRNEQNIGMVPNFNLALREAKGDYLCLVCDDDLILPGHIEEKAAILDSHPEIGFVYCPWVMIDGEGRSQAVPLGSGMLTYGYVGGRDEFGDLLQNNHIMMNSVLLRKSLLERHGYITGDARYSPSNDWELWLRLSRHTQTAYLPEPRVCVRFHEASETAKTGNNHTRSAAARLNLWRKYLLEEETPVVLNENVWERMRALFVQDLNYWFGGDQGIVIPYANEFDQIRADNRERASSRLWPAPSGPKTSETQIHWHANLFDFSGYARLGRDAILALNRAGVTQSAEAVGGSPKFLAQMEADPKAAGFWRGLQQARRTECAFVCFGVPALWNGGDWFGHHRAANPGQSRYVGICMFETDRLPAGWAAACNGMDEVWVPSEFNRETFTRSGVAPEKLHVIPFGIDASTYDPQTVQPQYVPGRRGFTFLSVFQWSERKGWDVLLKAYLKAFSAQDDVCLVLRTYSDREDATPIRERVYRFVLECGYDPDQSPAIVILDDFITDDSMPSLYRAADAFVLPTRGEGWGIPYIEAMASGLPVIATRWSAHLDFMNDENGYLIDIDGLVPLNPAIARENPFYTPDQKWAEPSVTHTARLMRQVFEQRDEAKARGVRARRDIIENWPLERTALWITGQVSTPNKAVVCAKSPSSTRRESGLSLSWQAPLFDPSGYAEEARHFLLALDEAGHTVAAESIRWSDRVAVLPAADERRLLAMTTRAPKPGGIHVSHIFPPSFTRRPNARLNAGRTMFETDRLPDGWADACNQMDQVWVPSEFNRETFARAGVREEKLRIVPGAIDMTVYPEDLAPLDILNSRGFNFLSVFDWSLRKGWDLLLRAYVEEFSSEDEVALIIKTHSSLGFTVTQIGEQIVGYIGATLGRDMSRTPDIILQDTNLPAHRMPNLYRAADCFVLPTRGEGWGRPYMEAMASGLPVIGTNWSGNTAFMNAENSYLLDCEIVDVPEAAWREAATFRGHGWAEPDVDQLRAHMRRVFTNREEARTIGRIARAHIAEHFSYERIVGIIEEIVQQSVPLAAAV
jgi:glycosyltransferase involved in cell wall biosynthesis